MLYTYKAKCINVVDGDTFDFMVDLGFYLTYKIRVRLKGIEIPEMRARTEQERQHAREAKAFVERLILDKTVTIESEKATGIYGRYGVHVILSGNEDLADKLYEAGFAKKEEY